MGKLEAFHVISASDAERMRNCLGPSKAFRPIAPNGNSTDGRQTFLLEAWFADFHPMCAHVCRHSPNVCTRLPTFTQCVHTSADIHPMCAHVCRLSPMVVHHAGPGIHGCASCWPWDPWLCTMLARSAMIDLPTIEGTPTRSPPVGTAAAGPARR